MKKFDIKKVLFLLVIVALIFTVAACAKTPTPSPGPVDPNPNPVDPGPDPEPIADVMEVLQGLLVGAGNLLNEVATNGQNDFHAEAKLALNVDVAAKAAVGTEGTDGYVPAREAFKLDGALRLAGIVSKTKTNSIGIEVIDNNCTVNGGVRFGIYMEYIPGTPEQTTFYLATNFASGASADAPSLYKFKNLNEIPFDKVSEVIDLFKGTDEKEGFGETLSGLSSTVTGLYDDIAGMKALIEGLIEAGETTKVAGTELYNSSLSFKWGGLGAILATLDLDLSSILGDLSGTVNGVLKSVLGFDLATLKDVNEDSDVADLSIVTTVDKTVAENPVLRGLMIDYDFNGIKVNAGIENIAVKAYSESATIITGKDGYDDGALQLKVNLDVPGLTGSLASPAVSNAPFFAEAVLTFTGSSDNNDDNNAVAEIYLYNNAEHASVLATLGYGTYVGAQDALYFDITALAEYLNITMQSTKFKMDLDIRGEIMKVVEAGYKVVLNGESQGRFTAQDFSCGVYNFSEYEYRPVSAAPVIKLNGVVVTPDMLVNGISLSEDNRYLDINDAALFTSWADATLGATDCLDATKRVLTVEVVEPAKLYDTVWKYGKSIKDEDIAAQGLKSGTFFKLLYKDINDPAAEWANVIKTVDGKPEGSTYYVNTAIKGAPVMARPSVYDFKLVTYPGETSIKEFGYYDNTAKAGHPLNITAGTANCSAPVIKEFSVLINCDYDVETNGTMLASDFAFEGVYFDISAFPATQVVLAKDANKADIKPGADGYGITFLQEGRYNVEMYYDCTFDANGVVASSLLQEKKANLYINVNNKFDVMGIIGAVMDAYSSVKDAVDAKNASATPFSAFGNTLKVSFINEIIDFIVDDPAIFSAVKGLLENQTVFGLVEGLMPYGFSLTEFITAVSPATPDANWDIKTAVDAWIAFYNDAANAEKFGRPVGTVGDATKPATYTLGGIAEWIIGTWGYEAGNPVNPDAIEGDPDFGVNYTTNLYDDIMLVINTLLSDAAKAQVTLTPCVDPNAPTKAEQLAAIHAYIDVLEFGVVGGSITEQTIAGKASDVFYGELFAALNDGTDSVTLLELGGSFSVVSKSYITAKVADAKFATPASGYTTVTTADAGKIGQMFLNILTDAVGLKVYEEVFVA